MRAKNFQTKASSIPSRRASEIRREKICLDKRTHETGQNRRGQLRKPAGVFPNSSRLKSIVRLFACMNNKK